MEELRHLLLGSKSDEKIEGIGIVRFNVHCNGNGDEVLCNCKDVLGVILTKNDLDWPSDNEWEKLLPEWFVHRCAKEQTEEETELWLKWWRELPRKEQIIEERKLEWSLSNWIAWFYPSERKWFWWDALVENKNLLRISVEIEEWPFPWKELDWLFRVSGATEIKPEED